MASDSVVVSVVGARPHFVKAFPLFNEIRSLPLKHVVLHTGQHYDYNMSAIFFEQLHMPTPDINLNVGSATHAEQTASIMIGVEKVVRQLNPKAVVVFGDTNSTLAAALAAAKYYFPIVHIEAGVRCFNRRMPEELNRIVVDHISDFNICPSNQAVENLEKESVTRGVLNCGDLMYDSFLFAKSETAKRRPILPTYGLRPKEYVLATLHREATTQDVQRLIVILKTFERIGDPVLLPMHPRTRNALSRARFSAQHEGLRIVEPVGYLDMLELTLNAKKIATDSGGLQKEAYWAGVPCITLMSETTWIETVQTGWNVLVGLDSELLYRALRSPVVSRDRPEVYGAPGVARRVIDSLGWRN